MSINSTQWQGTILIQRLNFVENDYSLFLKLKMENSKLNTNRSLYSTKYFSDTRKYSDIIQNVLINSTLLKPKEKQVKQKRMFSSLLHWYNNNPQNCSWFSVLCIIIMLF